MPHIPLRIQTGVAESEFDRVLAQQILSYGVTLANVINNGLRFTDNFDAQIQTLTTNGSADTEDAIAHTLKRVPTGFLILNRDKAGVVYDSGTAWTTTTIYLKCNMASVAITVMVF
jgi:hypothetical protein